MCMAMLNSNNLGNRQLFWECFSLEKGLLCLTDCQVKSRLQEGEVIRGFVLEGDMVKVDSRLCKNYMIRSGAGNYTPAYSSDTEMGVFYTALSESAPHQFVVVNSRFHVETMSEEKLKLLCEVSVVNGVEIDKTGRLTLLPDKFPLPAEKQAPERNTKK